MSAQWGWNREGGVEETRGQAEHVKPEETKVCVCVCVCVCVLFSDWRREQRTGICFLGKELEIGEIARNLEGNSATRRFS